MSIKPVPMTLKMSQVLELFQAYQAFGGFNKMNAKDEAVVVPYDIGGMTRIAIAMNAKELRPHVLAYEEAGTALRTQHLPDGFDPKSATLEERLARITASGKYTAEVNKMMGSEIEVKQRMITLAELNLNKNPLDPNILLILAPLLIEEPEGWEGSEKA